MSESFDKTLNLLKDLDLEDFSKHSFRGIEKESLRVSNKTISNTDHPVSLGSTLTNEFITTDFSEALLELICLLYTSPSPRDRQKSRMPSSA